MESSTSSSRRGNSREQGCALHGTAGSMAAPHDTRGGACVSQLTKGGLGGSGPNWAKRANRAKAPLSEPAPARQMTFEVTYGVGQELTGLRGGGSVCRVEHRDHVIRRG